MNRWIALNSFTARRHLVWIPVGPNAASLCSVCKFSPRALFSSFLQQSKNIHLGWLEALKMPLGMCVTVDDVCVCVLWWTEDPSNVYFLPLSETTDIFKCKQTTSVMHVWHQQPENLASRFVGTKNGWQTFVCSPFPFTSLQSLRRIRPGIQGHAAQDTWNWGQQSDSFNSCLSQRLITALYVFSYKATDAFLNTHRTRVIQVLAPKSPKNKIGQAPRRCVACYECRLPATHKGQCHTSRMNLWKHSLNNPLECLNMLQRHSFVLTAGRNFK